MRTILITKDDQLRKCPSLSPSNIYVTQETTSVIDYLIYGNHLPLYKPLGVSRI